MVAIPRVLAIVPRRGWAFERKALQIQRHLAESAAVDILEFAEVYRARGLECDVLIPLWWKWQAMGQLDGIVVRRGVVGAIYDAWSWTGARQGGLLDRTISNVDVLVVANDQFLTSMRQRFQRLPPVVVATDAVDLDEFQPGPTPSFPDQFTVAWVGNSKASSQISDDTDLKGLGLITEACQMINARLVRADLNGTYIAPADMPQWYLGCHVLAVGSLSEGGPCPMLEAAAMGRGLVSTRVGLAHRMIAHGLNGCIVDRSAGAIATGLAYMQQQFSAGHAAAISEVSRMAAEQFGARDVVRSSWGRAIAAAMTWGRPRNGH